MTNDERKIKELRQIGIQFEVARNALGWSRREAAEHAKTPKGHLSDKTVVRIENGYDDAHGRRIPMPPRAASVLALARALELDGEALCAEYGLEIPETEQYEMEPVTVEDIKADWERLQQKMMGFLAAFDRQ